MKKRYLQVVPPKPRTNKTNSGQISELYVGLRKGNPDAIVKAIRDYRATQEARP